MALPNLQCAKERLCPQNLTEEVISIIGEIIIKRLERLKILDD